MDAQGKTTINQDPEEEFSFKKLFVPLTSLKAIHWIVFIGIVVYANMLFNGFVLDDIVFILANIGIHHFNFWYLIGGTNNLFSNFGQYRPISALYFSVLYSLFNTTSFFYHFLQLLIHIVNALLLWILFRKFFSRYISLFITLVFLIHPIQVESVSYIATSDNPLFFLFGMTALLLSTSESINIKRISIISGLVLLSIFSKEAGVLFIIIILVYRYLFCKNRKILPISIGLFASVLFYCWVRFGLEHAAVTNIDFNIVPLATMSLPGRLMSGPEITLFYLKTFFFPLNLSLPQVWAISHVSISQFYIPLIIDFLFFLLIILLGIRILNSDRKNFTVFTFFTVWFIIGMGINLQIFPLDGTVADKWFYFPIVGLLGLIGLCVRYIKIFPQNLVKNSYLIAIALLILLSLRTIVRNADWANEDTLYNHSVAVSDDYVQEWYFGVNYQTMGQYPQALSHYLKAASLYPSELTLCSVGDVYLRMGELKKTQYYCALGLHSRLNNSQKHEEKTFSDIAQASILLGDFKEAKTVLTDGIKEYPQFGDLWAMMAITKYQLGLRTDALNDAAKSKSLGSILITNNIYNQIKYKLPLKLSSD
jgi:hypothetical protein